MDKNQYINALQQKCKETKKSDKYTTKVIKYAENLLEKGMPVIFDPTHFSMLVGYKTEFLYAITNSQSDFYRHFKIPKKNGKKRCISEPLPALKEIQYFILNNILLNDKCHDCSKAYRKNVSIRDNARFHRNQKIILKIDIKDYFPSLSESLVFDYFTSLGYSKALTTLLTKLCVLDHGLPQGAPTSPYLSNLLTQKMDNMIFELCRKNTSPLRYTRYADDITISGDFDVKEIIKKTLTIIYNNGLTPNYDKISVIRDNKSQIVTGIAVNKVIQAPKNYRKDIRKQMYYINKFGIIEHIKYSKIDLPPQKFCQQLLGKINYCLQINNKDSEMIKYKDDLTKIIKQNLL